MDVGESWALDGLRVRVCVFIPGLYLTCKRALSKAPFIELTWLVRMLAARWGLATLAGVPSLPATTRAPRGCLSGVCSLSLLTSEPILRSTAQYNPGQVSMASTAQHSNAAACTHAGMSEPV